MASSLTASAKADEQRVFKYALAAPAVFIMLMMGIAPLIYAVVVSFQRLSMSDEITSFQGLLNYARLLNDMRFWDAVLHTAIITVVALPIESSWELWPTLSCRALEAPLRRLLIIPS